MATIDADIARWISKSTANPQDYCRWEDAIVAEHSFIMDLQTQIKSLQEQIQNLQTILNENLFQIIIGNSDISLERGEN